MAITVEVPCDFLNPYCLGFNASLSSRYVCRWVLMILKIFPGISGRDMGLKFSGLFGGVPVFGMSVIMAVLNCSGKWPEAREALKMFVKCWIIIGGKLVMYFFLI